MVKGTNFEGIRDVADPVEMARMYNAAGADELVFYDITASFEGRALFTDILTRVASEIFIPLTVGGGINTLEDFDRVLKCGADKVSVNSGALRDPGLIPAAAQKYGDQCVVLSADVKRVNGQFRVFAKGGREDTGRDALDWISWCVAHGAGEICLNSIDTDGVRTGFDLEMLDAVEAYFAEVEKVAAKGPDILAHIDLIKKLNGEGEFFDEEAPRYRAAALKALSAAKEHNCLLEVNTGGVYRGYRKDFYPSAWMLEEWNKMGGKVIITSDSHDVSSLTFGFEEAAAAIKAAGFTSVEVLTGHGFETQEL